MRRLIVSSALNCSDCRAASLAAHFVSFQPFLAIFPFSSLAATLLTATQIINLGAVCYLIGSVTLVV